MASALEEGTHVKHMELLEKQKAIDDWLPITSSRNAKWYYSAFHNVTAMVGAGVLSLPLAMAELGWCVVFDLFLVEKTILHTPPNTQSRMDNL